VLLHDRHEREVLDVRIATERLESAAVWISRRRRNVTFDRPQTAAYLSRSSRVPPAVPAPHQRASIHSSFAKRPNTMSPHNIRPLGFGEILDGAFTLYRRNLAPFLITALIPIAVMAGAFALFGVGAAIAMASGDPSSIAGAAGAVVLMGLVGGMVYVVMWGGLTREVSEAYLGRPAIVGDGMRTGFRKALPIIGAGLIATLLIIIAVFAVMLVVGVIAAVGAASGSTAFGLLLGVVAGVLALTVYMLIIAVFFAIVPAIVVEDKGPIEAVGRSIDLARGALGRVVGLMVVTILITYLPVLAVGFLTGSFASIADPSTVPSAGQVVMQQVLGLGVSVLTTPFLVAVIVLLYFDRRVRTEALDVQMAADRLAEPVP